MINKFKVFVWFSGDQCVQCYETEQKHGVVYEKQNPDPYQ